MQPFELRKKSTAELRLLLRDEELRRESVALAIRQKKHKNVRELRMIRQNIARVRTLLAERARP